MITDYIKKNSSILHDAAEERLGSAKIFSKGYTPEDYTTLLRHHYHFIASCEPPAFLRISAPAAHEIALEKRRKLPVLSQELTSLGLEVPSAISQLDFSSEAEALGAIYVMEGATLGGSVIARHLGATPGFEGFTFPYLTLYGKETGVLWSNFKSFIDKMAVYTPEAVLAGVKKAYQTLLQE